MHLLWFNLEINYYQNVDINILKFLKPILLLLIPVKYRKKIKNLKNNRTENRVQKQKY